VQNAYRLRGGSSAAQILRRGADFLQGHRQRIDSILRFARGKTARTLELLSTIVHVARSERLGGSGDEEALVERVFELKPKFDKGVIRRQIEELRGLDDLPWLGRA
jgi:hypothetical protein